jgi:hypothetical protein
MASNLKRVFRRIFSASALPFIILAGASIAFVSVQAPQHAEFSPYDEYVYFDYLTKVPTQGFVHSGEETGEAARNELSCRGVLNYGAFGEQCNRGIHSRDSTYPYSGETGADIHPPLYFAVTWVLAQPLTWVGISLMDAGRLVGGAWLALGTMSLFALLSLLRVPRWTGFGLSLFVIATPATFWATTYISTDAPTLALAAGVAAISVLVAQRRVGFAWLPLISIIAVLFKVQNLVAVGLSCLALAAYVIVELRSKPPATDKASFRIRSIFRDGRFVSAAAAAVLGIAAQAAWLVVRAQATLPGTEPFKVDTVRLPLTLTSLVNECFRFLWTIGATGLSSGLVGILAANLLGLVAIATTLGVVLDARRHPRIHVIIASVTLVMALLMGPALAIAASAAVGFYFPLPDRYGLVLLPAFVACIGLWFSRYSRASYAVLGVGSVFALAAIPLG